MENFVFGAVKGLVQTNNNIVKQIYDGRLFQTLLVLTQFSES